MVWLRRPDLGESSSYKCHERINAAPMSCLNTLGYGGAVEFPCEKVGKARLLA